MSKYTDAIATSSNTIIHELYQSVIKDRYYDIIANSMHIIQPTECSGNLIVFLEEINELCVEIIQQTESYETADMMHLIEEWTDNLLNVAYVIIGLGYQPDDILNTKQVQKLFNSKTPFALFFQNVTFELVAGYPNPEPKHPMTAVCELQNISKAVSKYLRHKLTKEELIPYLQKYIIVLFTLKLYFRMSKRDIQDWIEKKLSRIETRIQNNEVH